MSKIDVLLLRREFQDLLFRAIELIDELRASKESYSIIDRIKSLESQVYKKIKHISIT